MSELIKLGIRGIRSFSQQREEVIHFEQPLTLILGENGSGKTTIIECLKMMCTGEYPPNSSQGRYFIHDPKLEGDRETRALIKLFFDSASGDKITGTRGFRLNVTQRGLAIRQCDHLIKFTGEAGNTTTNFSGEDMNLHMRGLFGVAPAVLTHVVFCHQEDSLWPFADQATLKKIFDELFETRIYTKQLDELYSVEKECKIEAKNFVTQEALLRKDLEQLKMLTESYERVREDQKESGEREAELKGKLDEIQNTKNILKQEETKVEGAHGDLKLLAFNYKTIKTRIQKIEENSLFKKLEYSDQELRSTVNETTTLSRGIDLEVSQKKKEMETLQNTMDEFNLLDGKLRVKIEIQKEYQTLENENIRKMKNILEELEDNELFRDVKDKGIYEDSTIGAAKDLIKYYEEFGIEIRNSKIEVNNKIEKMNYDIKLKEESKLMLERKNKERILKVNELKDIKSSQYKSKGKRNWELMNITEEIKQYEMDLQKFKLDEHSDSLFIIKQRNQIKDLHSQRATFQLSIQKLQELLQINIQREKLFNSKISRKGKDEIIQKLEKAYYALINDIKPDCIRQNIAIDEQNPAKLLHSIKYITENTKQNLAQKEADQDSLSILNVKKTTQQVSLRKQIIKLEEEKKEILDEIRTLTKLHLSSLENFILTPVYTYEKECKAKLDEKWGGIPTEAYWTEIKQHNSTNNSCYLCQKKVSTAEQSLIKTRIGELITESKTYKTNSDLFLNEYYNSLKASVLAEIYEGYSNKIVNMERKMEQSIKPNQAKMENIMKKFGEEKEKLKVLESLQVKSTEMVILFNILSNNLNWVQSQNKSYKVKQKESQKVTEEQLVLEQNKLDVLNQEINDKENDLMEDESELRQIQRKINELIARKLEIMTKDTETIQNVNILYELKSSIETARQEIQEISKYVKSQKRIVEDINTKEIRAIKNNEKEINKMKEDIEVLKDLVSEIQTIYKMKEEKGVKNTDLGKELSTVADKEEELKYEISKLQSRITELLMSKENQDILILNIEMNMEMEELCNKKLEIKDKSLKTKELHDKYLIIKCKKEEIEKEQQEYSSKYNKILGRKQNQKEEERRITQQMKDPKFDRLEKRLLLTMMEQLTAKKLGEFFHQKGEIIEESLMIFHNNKMEEINYTIKNIWKDTYKGNDIDTLIIKSDTTKATARTRNYNYRVVFKTARIMEMEISRELYVELRATHLALASLIIRLALAEIFCDSCGIIALDEPTTNLDTEHIRNFAQCVRNIIESKEYNSKFQLIIITHDQELVSFLGRDYVRKVVFVKKDNNGFTIIKSRAIEDMLE